MDTLRALVGAVFGSALVASGIATGLLGIIPLREPTLLGLLLAIPVVVTHPTFLVLWAVIAVAACAWVLIERVRSNRSFRG